MLTYSKSWRSIRSRTGSLYSRARTKLASSFRSNRRHLSPGDAESTSAMSNTASIEDDLQNSDHWVISSDFEPTADGQLAVHKGEKVEVLEDQPSDAADWTQVAVVDDPSRTGLVPSAILLPGWYRHSMPPQPLANFDRLSLADK